MLIPDRRAIEPTAEQLDYLDTVRASGSINMFEAVPWLQATFPDLTNQRAREVLASWMGSFNQRHPLDPHGVGPSRAGV